MLEQHVPEIRQELAATRVSALRRSAEPAPVGPLRRALGAGLVRLGLRLGYDGHVPPLVSQLSRREETPTGVSNRPTVSLPNFRAGITRS
jgi:hypothetical protein